MKPYLKSELITTLSKWTLSLVVMAFLGAMAALGFFAHPNTDDYTLGINLREHGFWEYQHYIYLHWGGRYFSNLMGAMFGSNGFLFKHYFVHTTLLILTTIGGLYVLLSTANIYLLQKAFKWHQLLLSSMVGTILCFSCYPEASTAYYWFSSAITYQLSFGLWCLAVSYTLRAIHESNGYKQLFSTCLATIFIVSVNGTNEVAAIALGITLILLLLINFKKLKQFKLLVITILVVYGASFLVEVLAPGNAERLTYLGERKSIMVLFAITIIRIAYFFWNIFQSALFWISLLAMIQLGFNYHHKLTSSENNAYTIPRILFLFFFALVLLTMPILLVSNGSLPERATNLIIAFSSITLLGIGYYVGCLLRIKIEVLKNINVVPPYLMYVIIIIGVLCNKGAKDIFTSAFSAKLFHPIMVERENQLKNAHSKTICLDTYDANMDKKYKQLFGQSQNETTKKWIIDKPILLFFSDELLDSASTTTLEKYYQTRKICIIQ